MKKKLLRLLSILMAVLLLCTAGAPALHAAAPVEASAATSTGGGLDTSSKWLAPLEHLHWPASVEDCGEMLKRVLCDYVDLILDLLLRVILYFMPDVGWPELSEYQPTQFYPGDASFLDTPAEGAQWSLGYAKASLLTGGETDGKHYHAGGFSFPAEPVTKILDDQAVRVICLSDGSGRGVKAFVTLDSYGISLTDVREIRSRLASFAQENGIDAINVAAVHQHSCIDTLGLGGDPLRMLIGNALITKYQWNLPIYNGKNTAFMENLFQVTAEAVRQAYASMEPGSLYVSQTDVSAYMRDKREPEVFDPYMTRLRFCPEDGSRETWIVNSAIHPTTFGTQSTEISSDFPYYMEQTVSQKADANFIFFQGAELGITAQRQSTDREGNTALENAKAYGARLGEILCGINTAEETELSPLLNLRIREITIPVDNQILVLAAKGQAVNNVAVKTEEGVSVVTEIGYLELGDTLCVLLIPGEIAPELIYGGCLSASQSWSGEDWPFAPLTQSVPERRMLVFGLTNDQVGYILPDNDVCSIISGVNEEVVSMGKRSGSTLVTQMQALIDSIG